MELIQVACSFHVGPTLSLYNACMLTVSVKCWPKRTKARRTKERRNIGTEEGTNTSRDLLTFIYRYELTNVLNDAGRHCGRFLTISEEKARKCRIVTISSLTNTRQHDQSNTEQNPT